LETSKQRKSQERQIDPFRDFLECVSL